MSKTDIDKIIELIESDDQDSQELGCIMAVSQGLRHEVLKEFEKRVIDLVNQTEFRGCKIVCKILGFHDFGRFSYLDLELTKGVKCNSLTNSKGVKKYKKIIKLKEFVLL